VETITKQSLKKILVWILLLLALVGTFVLTRQLEKGSSNTASIFLGGIHTHEVEIYSDKAVPVSVVAKIGDEIVFKIMDEAFHNIAEQRSSKRGVRLESGELKTGESYILSFSSPGEYYFYDRMNLDINVTITVQD